MDEAIYVCLDCHEEFDEPHDICPACGEEMSPNAKVPLDAQYAVYMLMTKCSRCGQPLPLNGPQRTVNCSACHNENHFPPERWKSLLEDFVEEYEEFGWADSRSSTIMTGGGTFELTYGKQVPHCPKCHKALATYDLPVGADEVLICPKCEIEVPTFPAPDWLKEVLPTAVQLYAAEREAGDTPAGAVEAAGADAVRPVVMSCPQCGGALKVTPESERLVPCEYCQVDVYLPDDVWHRMHPVKTSDRWMVRFEGAARAADAVAEAALLEEEVSDDVDSAPSTELVIGLTGEDNPAAEPRQRSVLPWVFIAIAAAAGLVYLLVS